MIVGIYSSSWMALWEVRRMEHHGTVVFGIKINVRRTLCILNFNEDDIEKLYMHVLVVGL